MHHRWKLALAVLALACAPTKPVVRAPAAAAPPRPPATPAPAPPSGPGPFAAEARAIADDVVRLRGLPEKSPLIIKVHDVAELRELVGAQASEDVQEHAVSERAEWLAFGLAPPELDPAVVVKSTLQDEVAGFYDPRSRELHVLREAPPKLEKQKRDVLRHIVAHEAEHALQDQSFGMPRPGEDDDEDDRHLAEHALYEGEAELVSTLLTYGDQLPMPKLLVSRIRRMMARPERELLSAAGSRVVAGDGAPRSILQAMMFPYVHGLRFVAELYGAGGLPLVNRAFEHPPQSTEQVMHVEKYLAGERPVDVAWPEAGADEKVLARGRMGEIEVGITLGTCLEPVDAVEAAQGWGGDAYTVSEKPGRALVVRWATAWDSEKDAKQFAARVKQMGRCWHDVTSPVGWTISSSLAVKQQGARVAVVRGLPAAEAERATEPLLRAPPAPAAPQPPLGEVALLPDVPEPKAGTGKRTAAGWENPSLGLASALPAGMEVKLDAQDAVLQLTRAAPPAYAAVAFVPVPDRPEVREDLFQRTAAGLDRRLPRGAYSIATLRTTSVAGLPGTERRWSASDVMTTRVIVVPICRGQAILVFSGVSVRARRRGQDEEADLVETWLRSVRSTTGTPPVCDAFGP